MADWFPPELDSKVYVEASESGFTSNEIAIKWLQHFIAHSDSGPECDWKLLIMDNHGSHETPEFIQLANDNHILPYPLIPHMTHCMQPLDVGIFQPYKHWHDAKIKEAVANLDVEYCIRSFLRDLGFVRDNTFKKTTIRHAFEKSGIWPIDAQKALAQIKTFSPPDPPRPSTPELPPQPGSPRGAAEVDSAWMEYERLGKVDQMLEALSSPTRAGMKSLISKNRETLAHSVLSDAQLGNLKRKHQDDLQRKTGSRKRVQQFGGLTAGHAQRKLEEKARKEQETEQRKRDQAHAKLVRAERKTVYRQGVEDRKAERARKKQVRDLQKGNQEVPIELQAPIVDREQVWKDAEIERTRTIQRHVDDDVEFVIDTEGDPSLRLETAQQSTTERDFIPLCSSPPPGRDRLESPLDDADDSDDTTDSDVDITL